MNNTVKCILTFILCLAFIPILLSFMAYVVNMPTFVSAYILNYICYSIMVIAILSVLTVLTREDDYYG